MFMRKRILKWQRDQAVRRLTRNCRVLDYLVTRNNGSVWLQSREFEIERLRRAVERDKDFIRKTA